MHGHIYVQEIGGEEARPLTVLNSFRAHLKVEQLLRESNVTALTIPGGCTFKIQPLDVSVNSPLKQVLK